MSRCCRRSHQLLIGSLDSPVSSFFVLPKHSVLSAYSIDDKQDTNKPQALTTDISHVKQSRWVGVSQRRATRTAMVSSPRPLTTARPQQPPLQTSLSEFRDVELNITNISPDPTSLFPKFPKNQQNRLLRSRYLPLTSLSSGTLLGSVAIVSKSHQHHRSGAIRMTTLRET